MPVLPSSVELASVADAVLLSVASPSLESLALECEELELVALELLAPLALDALALDSLSPDDAVSPGAHPHAPAHPTASAMIDRRTREA
jgi:hypothetical protein